MKKESSVKTVYVLAFIFDPKLKKVLLIKKNRPDWQKGRLNGVGGHLEKNEEPKEAITREVREESGLIIDDWIFSGKMSSEKWDIHVFTTKYRSAKKAKTLTDEVIDWYDLANLPSTILPNLPWLIHFCKEKYSSEQLSHFDVWYIPGQI